MTRAAVDRFLNSRNRSGRHVAAGMAVIVGTALAASVATGMTASRRETSKAHEGRPITERPRNGFSILIPALMSAATLAGLRVWNAPSGPTRTGALRLWGASQAVSAFWLAARPRSLSGQIVSAMMTAGMAAAFAHEARKLDVPAGLSAAPMGAAVRLGNLIGDRLRPARPVDATLH